MLRLFYRISSFCCALILATCSWRVQFLIINAAATPREVTIELDVKSRGFLIFDPRKFTLYPYDEEIDYTHEQSAAKPLQGSLKIVIPPKSALVIGRLNNQHYENSRQRFINDRVFNLVRVQAGKHEVTRDSFDQHFRKTAAGLAYQIPSG